MKEQNLQEKSLQDHLLNKEKEKLKHHLDEMQFRISDHQNSMSVLQQEHEKVKRESKYLHEQLTILSNQLCQKEVEIGTLKQDMGLHEEKLQQSADDISEQAPQFEEVVRKLEDKTKDGVRELTVLREELESSVAREEALKAKCSQLEHSLFERSRNGESTNELETVVAQLTDFKQVLQEKKLELSEAVTAQSNLSGLLSARGEEVKTLTQALEESKQTILSNKSVIGKLCTDKEEAIKEWEALKTLNISLSDDLFKLKTKLQEDRRLLKDEDGQLQILQQENAKYTKQLANLRSHLIEVHYSARCIDNILLGLWII